MRITLYFSKKSFIKNTAWHVHQKEVKMDKITQYQNNWTNIKKIENIDLMENKGKLNIFEQIRFYSIIKMG
jgi:hypothetical protein